MVVCNDIIFINGLKGIKIQNLFRIINYLKLCVTIVTICNDV